jgi:hypothetical protein
MNHWIISLPGTHLQGLRSAGAPSLESLAGQGFGNGGDLEPDDWRGWILYGPPDQALLEQSLSGDQASRGQSLRRWSQQMVLATQAKRAWRHRLMLIHLYPGCAGVDPSAAVLELEQALPELELQARLRRQAHQCAIPSDLTTMAAICLLQADSALLQAYIDLEAWADQPSQDDTPSRWSTKPSHDLILNALSAGRILGSSADQAELSIARLTNDLRRCEQERSHFQHTLEQLESELEHYVAEHLDLNETTSRLESQLLRARRLIQA